MDFLVSLSSTLIYLYSAYVTFMPRRSYKLYFASDGVLLSLILFGKYMEQVAAGEANSAIRKLMHLQPRTALVQRGDTFVELPVDQIAEHDRVRIRPGERVPVDGTIISGQCAVDESMLTGESMPVDKAPGDKVIGGSLNRSGSAIVSAEALGKASVLEQIIQIVRQAQCEKAPVQRFADKVARWFVPGVIGAAALTFLIWYRRVAPRNLERALLTCYDVLSVACPCALGLATPTGLMVGSGRAAEHGILFKSGAELENAYKADCVVFDKTGTLTNGAPALTDVCPCSAVRPETLVRLAAALEQCSDHPLARAVTVYAQQQSDAPLPPAEDFSYALGRGVRGTVAGAAVVCGSRTWLRELGIDTAALAALPDLRAQAKTELCVARGGQGGLDDDGRSCPHGRGHRGRGRHRPRALRGAARREGRRHRAPARAGENGLHGRRRHQRHAGARRGGLRGRHGRRVGHCHRVGGHPAAVRQPRKAAGAV